MTWYSTQQEHWLGWLREYDGPGAYNRSTLRGRSAEYAYNHIQCAPMLLWLAEAVEVPEKTLRTASSAAAAAGSRSAAQCAALRREIPWRVIAQRILV
ncbi:hypothetical protein FFK22_026530 [Mycobacterium sp. KBS0706]|nr:hypothetical protein FFK22_026530 [Mycobacterium sp. KBS0706]